MSEPNLSQPEFTAAMAAELDKYGWSESALLAADALGDFLKDEGIEYGDPDYGWTSSDAVSLTWEFFAE